MATSTLSQSVIWGLWMSVSPIKPSLRYLHIGSDKDWDTALHGSVQVVWKMAIRSLMEQEEVLFNRGTKPKNAVGRPELVGYWDGSLLAYAALVYIRWLLDTDPSSWSSSLLCAKVRVTLVAGLTTPRTELNGAVVLGKT